MPDQQHIPKSTKTYHIGVNTDDDPEIVKDGFAIRARNMRPNHQGDVGSDKKISGETVLFPGADNRCNINTTFPNTITYECIGKSVVNGHIVEFLADKSVSSQGLPFVRVDGWIVLMATTQAKFGIQVSFPIQTDKNDACIGGEVFATDNNIPPFVLNVEDMLINSGIDPVTNQRDTVNFPCTDKYFGQFDIVKYQVQPPRPIDHPIFMELVDAGNTPNSVGRIEKHGTGGMKVGSYQYTFRYVKASGDTTQFVESTPVIPMPKKNAIYGHNNNPTTWQYPTAKVFGAAASLTTANGIHIRFRVNNVNDFNTIEIKRTSYIAGLPPATLGVEELLPKIAITSNELSIIDFYDYDNTSSAPATPEDVSDNMSVIESAKSLRYYNNRLDLFNIKYASRNLEGQLLFDTLGGKEMLPISYAMGVDGYGDVWNQVYKKNYMHGEKFGFGIVAYDTEASRSFAASPSISFDNYKMPERRDKLDGDSLIISSYYQSPVLNLNPEYTKAVNSESTPAVTQTFEVFDLEGGVDKNSSYNINMVDGAGAVVVLSPINDADTNVAGFDYHIDDAVGVANFVYNPKGFAPNYYALGMSLVGISSMPTWIRAFSVVRTAPAKRVVAQGLGFYYMSRGTPATKHQAKLWWDSPDTYSGLENITAIASDSSRYRAQLVSPLGFFSEVYSGYQSPGSTNGSSLIDMICYGNIVEDHGQINTDEGLGSTYSVFGISSGGKQYVSWNSWRNTSLNSTTPNEIFSFLGITVSDGYGSNHRHKPSSLHLNSNIYSRFSPSPGYNFQDSGVRNWHEPLYITNIIDPNVDIVNSLTQEYFETGAYIKTESIIGKGDGATDQYILVDERWEDCIPALDASLPVSITNQDRYVYIQTGSVEQVWLNVTYKTVGDVTTIKNDIQANGFYVSTRPDGSIAEVTGIFTHSISSNSLNPLSYSNRNYYVVFDQVDNLSNPFIPQTGQNIIVRYDHNAPISVGGGDSFIGQYAYCPVDYDLSGSGFDLNVAFPYEDYRINSNVKQTVHAQLSEILVSNKVHMNQLRQLLVMGIVESRENTQLSFDITTSSSGRFPNVHYRQRPSLWDTSNPPGSGAFNTANNILSYASLYNSESALWEFGGFRFLPTYNNDYLKDPIDLTFFSRPKIGYVEQNTFCARTAWSSKRPINKTGAAGILTFPPLNVFDIGEETGEIKFAWDALSGSGSNLYAFTEHGICLLLTEKRVLSELNTNTLAVMGSANPDVIQDSMWISKVIGMNDEMWRSVAEWDNVIRFSNKNSSYEFANNKITDIGRKKFHKRLYNDFLSKLKARYKTDVTAVYDTLFNEYWLEIRQRRKIWNPIPGAFFHVINIPAFNSNSNDIYAVEEGDIIEVYLTVVGGFSIRLPLMLGHTLSFVNISPTENVTILDNSGATLQIILTGESYTFTGFSHNAVVVSSGITNEFKGLLVYSEQNESWFDTFDYNFDKFVSFDNKTYGMKNGATYEMNSGLQINGTDIIGEVVGVCNDKFMGKEFVRLRVGSDVMPSKAEFYKSIDQLIANTPVCILDSTVNAYAFKIRNGYEQYIPRETGGNKLRCQGTMLIFKISHFRANEEFKVTDTEVEYKELK